MQDRYYFWVQMAQADQASISAWETAVRTAAGRCSVGPNADEFIRDKFLFGLNDSFSRFREDIFYRDGQCKAEDPPFTLAFVVTQAVSFEAALQTNKLLVHSSIEEQVHYTMSTTLTRNFQRPPGRPVSKSCFFCGSKTPHPREKMSSPRTNMQLLPQAGPLFKRLPTGCQRSRIPQTTAQKAPHADSLA